MGVEYGELRYESQFSFFEYLTDTPVCTILANSFFFYIFAMVGKPFEFSS
jgi:hypothetical protein